LQASKSKSLAYFCSNLTNTPNNPTKHNETTSDRGEVRRWRARRDAEAAVAAAEAALARRAPGAAAALTAAERRLEAALDGCLGDGDEGFEVVGEDDYVESEADEGPSDLDSDLDSALEANGKRKRRGGAANGGSGGVKKKKGQGKAQGKGKGGGVVIEDGEPPPSFSRVDVRLPPAELRRRFPKFPGLEAALAVEVAAGECLYLPAGWFHEVTSYSTPGGLAVVWVALGLGWGMIEFLSGCLQGK
jgi:hypothetical protein